MESVYIYLPAGEIGGIIGKKLGLGKDLARPVIRQNDIVILGYHLVSESHKTNY